MKAHLRRTQISPKKANIVAGLIRGKSVEEALDILKFTPKKASTVIYKTLHSAVANAEGNEGKKRENLKVAHVIVNKGPVYKRHLASTRGRALPIHKPTAHITIELTDK